MNVQAIIKRLEAVGKRADAAALREVAALYRTVSLADLIALVQVGLDRTSPRLRLAQLDSLMGAFDQAAVNLGTPPASVLSQIEGVITANVTAAGDMLAAGGIVDAFRVQPAMQLEWAETAAERMKRYWLTETARTRGEVQAALVEGLTRGQSSQQVAPEHQGAAGCESQPQQRDRSQRTGQRRQLRHADEPDAGRGDSVHLEYGQR